MTRSRTHFCLSTIIRPHEIAFFLLARALPLNVECIVHILHVAALHGDPPRALLGRDCLNDPYTTITTMRPPDLTTTTGPSFKVTIPYIRYRYGFLPSVPSPATLPLLLFRSDPSTSRGTLSISARLHPALRRPSLLLQIFCLHLACLGVGDHSDQKRRTMTDKLEMKELGQNGAARGSDRERRPMLE